MGSYVLLKVRTCMIDHIISRQNIRQVFESRGHWTCGQRGSKLWKLLEFVSLLFTI